jgi:type I restriction enzyme S subunit
MAADVTRDGEDDWAVLKLSAVTGGTYRPQHHKVLGEAPGANTRYEVRAGDLLMTRANTPQLVGDVAYVSSTPRHLLLPDLVYRLGYDANRADGNYLAFALRTPEVRGQLAAIARGSSQSMVKLRAEDIKALTIALPAVARQRRLASQFIARAESGAATHKAMLRQIDLLLERRQALVTEAVTGELACLG